MKDVFVITCNWNNNESYMEDRLEVSEVVGVFETFEDAQNAFDDILKQRQDYIDKINVKKRAEAEEGGFTLRRLKIINVKRKPGYMYFAVENDKDSDMHSNNTYAINKFTLGEVEKFGEEYGPEVAFNNFFILNKEEEEEDDSTGIN